MTILKLRPSIFCSSGAFNLQRFLQIPFVLNKHPTVMEHSLTKGNYNQLFLKPFYHFLVRKYQKYSGRLTVIVYFWLIVHTGGRENCSSNRRLGNEGREKGEKHYTNIKQNIWGLRIYVF